VGRGPLTRLSDIETGCTDVPRHASGWRGKLHIVNAVLWGIVLTIVFHRYTVLSGFDLVQADPPSDSRFTAPFLEHWFQVLRGIDHWRSPPWFFPKGETLGYADVMFGMAIPYSVFRAFGAGTFVAMNLTLVLLSFLSYLACLWLLRGVLGFHWLASIAGAAFFAFNYPKFAMLHHIKLVFDMLKPIVLGLFLSLLVSREMPSQQRTFVTCLWAALLFALLASTTFVNAWFLFLLLLVCLTIALLDRELRRQIFSLLRHRWLAAVAGLFLGGIGLLPLILLYLPVFTETGAWHWFGVLKNIPQPAQLIWMGTDNLAWGWLAARWPDLDDANWSEMRIGYGAVATIVWLALVGFSAMQLTRRTPLTADHEQPRRCVGRVVAVLLVASLAIVLLGIQIDGRSPWYLVYRLLPGGAGVRSVSRYILTLSLPLAIGFAYALDKFLARPRSKIASATVAATVVVVGVEQLATIKYMYSAYEAEQFGASIVGMVDRRCAAFYLKPTRNYAQHGKYPTRAFLEDHYHLTASLAALAGGVPTVNGIGAKYPPGWDLSVFDRNIEERVENWVRRNRYNGRVCLLERDLNGSEIPVRSPLGFFAWQSRRIDAAFTDLFNDVFHRRAFFP
jgi:hypothetical protein